MQPLHAGAGTAQAPPALTTLTAVPHSLSQLLAANSSVPAHSTLPLGPLFGATQLLPALPAAAATGGDGAATQHSTRGLASTSFQHAYSNLPSSSTAAPVNTIILLQSMYPPGWLNPAATAAAAASTAATATTAATAGASLLAAGFNPLTTGPFRLPGNTSNSQHVAVNASVPQTAFYEQQQHQDTSQQQRGKTKRGRQGSNIPRDLTWIGGGVMDPK